MGWALVFSPGGGATMAAAEGLEPIHCTCGALVMRANEEGIEVHCRRCDRRWVVPFAELHGKDTLVRFMEVWRAQAKCP